LENPFKRHIQIEIELTDLFDLIFSFILGSEALDKINLRQPCFINYRFTSKGPLDRIRNSIGNTIHISFQKFIKKTFKTPCGTSLETAFETPSITIFETPFKTLLETYFKA